MKLKQVILGMGLITILVVAAACAPAPAPAPAEPEPTPPTDSVEEPVGEYKDGTYRAEMDEFDPQNGWKDSVEITVVGGKITEANWNGTHKDGGEDKKTASKNGNYPMVEQGGAKAPWHEQAALAEAYLIQSQDPTTMEYSDEDGHSDAVSGATITVKEFFTLAAEALETAK